MSEVLNNPGLNINSFLEGLDDIKRSYCIRYSTKRITDIESRRIAILVANCYLEHGGNVNQAGFLERKVYEAVKVLDLTCEPIPDEIRIRELACGRGMHNVYRGFNPLKLAIEGSDNYLIGGYTPLVAIIIRKLNTIEEVKEHESAAKFKDRRLDQRGAFNGGLQSWKINSPKMAERKEFAVCSVR